MDLLLPTVPQFPQEKLVGLKNKRDAVSTIMRKIRHCFLLVLKSFWIIIVTFSCMQAFRLSVKQLLLQLTQKRAAKVTGFEQQSRVISFRWAVSKPAYSEENLALQTLSVSMLEGIYWSFGLEMKFLSSFDQSSVKSRCFQWRIHNDAKIFFFPMSSEFHIQQLVQVI